MQSSHVQLPLENRQYSYEKYNSPAMEYKLRMLYPDLSGKDRKRLIQLAIMFSIKLEDAMDVKYNLSKYKQYTPLEAYLRMRRDKYKWTKDKCQAYMQSINQSS
jgi:hypothetical protein